jgi:hypothetical protein
MMQSEREGEVEDDEDLEPGVSQKMGDVKAL